ncbi:hypothetical protein ACFO0M_02515 [Micromonospora mangrovi]|uniref:Protein kinase domain-containing protein n=2 Tax=Micromonospora TaxID=1873 RepID=A0AAU8H813_9ACTN
MTERNEPDDIRVPQAELRRLVDEDVLIEDGGNAVIYWCEYRQQRYLYKRFREEHRTAVDEAALVRLVRWRRALSPASRTELDQLAAWPRHVVYTDTGQLGGVLMPAAGPRYFRPVRDGRRTPRGLYELIGSPNRPGAPLAVRVSVLGRLIKVVRWLHRQGVVVNDLQPDNLLYHCAESGAAVYAVDCDSMVSPAQWGRTGPLAVPDLMSEVLPVDTEPTVETDLTKLFWIVARVLLDEPSAIGIGPRDQALLLGAVPAATRRHMTALLHDPTDQASWAALATEWNVPLPPRSSPRRPPEPVPAALPRWSHRGGWLPPGWSYRPPPGPPVLPARLNGKRTARSVRVAVSALVGSAAAAMTLLSVLIVQLVLGGR